jgi:hypothetical protein
MGFRMVMPVTYLQSSLHRRGNQNRYRIRFLGLPKIAADGSKIGVRISAELGTS